MNLWSNFSGRSGHSGHSGMRLQAGYTLMEGIIAMALSLVVTSAMVVLMGNSMGTATRMIQMAQMTDQLRNAMSMMTRDVRRANYTPDGIKCFANSDCGADGTATQLAGDVVISGGNCVTFNLNRWAEISGVQTKIDGFGGFRLQQTNAAPPIGVIEMWVGTTAPACNATSTDWIAITDPDFIDVVTFAVDDSRSFTGSVEEASGTISQRSRKLQIQIESELLRDRRITRRIEDVIQVRNDIFL